MRGIWAFQRKLTSEFHCPPLSPWGCQRKEQGRKLGSVGVKILEACAGTGCGSKDSKSPGRISSTCRNQTRGEQSRSTDSRFRENN